MYSLTEEIAMNAAYAKETGAIAGYLSTFNGRGTDTNNRPIYYYPNTMCTIDGTPIEDYGNYILSDTPLDNPQATWTEKIGATK